MDLEQFKALCDSKGFVEVKNYGDEIVTYAWKNSNGENLVYVEWSDACEDDFAEVTVAVNTFVNIYAEYHNSTNSCSDVTEEWLTAEIDEAMAAAKKADSCAANTEMNFQELREMLHNLRWYSDSVQNELRQHTVSLGINPETGRPMTVREFYDKLNQLQKIPNKRIEEVSE